MSPTVRLKSFFAQTFCLLLIPVFPLFAQEFQLESDQPIEFDEANKKMIATGEASLTYGDLILRANRIEYDQESGLADAIGNIRYSWWKDTDKRFCMLFPFSLFL